FRSGSRPAGRAPRRPRPAAPRNRAPAGLAAPPPGRAGEAPRRPGNPAAGTARADRRRDRAGSPPRRWRGRAARPAPRAPGPRPRRRPPAPVTGPPGGAARRLPPLPDRRHSAARLPSAPPPRSDGPARSPAAHRPAPRAGRRSGRPTRSGPRPWPDPLFGCADSLGRCPGFRNGPAPAPPSAGRRPAPRRGKIPGNISRRRRFIGPTAWRRPMARETEPSDKTPQDGDRPDDDTGKKTTAATATAQGGDEGD